MQDAATDFMPILNSPSPRAHAQEAPVQISIRITRVLSMAAALVLVLGLISSILIRGITLKERSANGLTDADKSDLLDRYNTYTGAFFSVVAMPFQQVVLVVMPVFFLCFATSAILSESKSFVQKWAPLGVTVAASLLIGQGMNAVNVQFDSPRTDFIISAGDLVSSNTGTFSFVVTNVSDSTSIKEIPSTDTIVRNAVQSAASTDQTSCTWSFGWAPNGNEPEASIRFGFPLQSWLEYALPRSLESGSSFKFSVSDNFSADTTVMPDWSLDKTAKLFSYGMSLALYSYTDSSEFKNALYTLFPLDIYDLIDTSDDVQMLGDMQAAISTNGSFWSNISVAEMTVEFSSFQLSDHIQFDAVTFELPVELDTMQAWLNDYGDAYSTNKSGTDYYTDFVMYTNGNDHAFVLPSPKTMDDQVRILRLCLQNENDTDDDLLSFTGARNVTDEFKCVFPSKTSALIYSFAQHITMDEATVYLDEYQQPTFRMKNHRKIYSITVGKLSWQTSDLALVYGAQCDVEGQCDGLYFPLSNNNQHIVVGEAHIPIPAKNYSSLASDWQVLVSSKTEIVATGLENAGTRYHIDLIYPPNYPIASDSLPWTQSGLDCSQPGSGFIDDVIQRHIYSKDPVQPAYTAGLFWLFGNAALHNIENSTNPTAVKLDFIGNLKWISPRISMPRASAIMTIVGSGLIFVVALAINVWSRNQNQQREFHRHLFSAHNVGGILFNASQFPPLLLRTKVQQSAKEENSPQNPNDELGDYMITEMTLRRRTDTAENAIFIRSAEADEVPL